MALEEYEKLSKENLFFNTQKEDLVNSKKELIKVISHIDRLCGARFRDMLEEVNKRFSKVFPLVFQGNDGKAELILRQGEEDSEPGTGHLHTPAREKATKCDFALPGGKGPGFPLSHLLLVSYPARSILHY